MLQLSKLQRCGRFTGSRIISEVSGANAKKRSSLVICLCAEGWTRSHVELLRFCRGPKAVQAASTTACALTAVVLARSWALLVHLLSDWYCASVHGNCFSDFP